MLVTLLALQIPALALQEIHPVMQKQDSSYSLSATFTTTLSEEQLMEVLLSYNHMKKYVKQPNLTLTLQEESLRSNRLSYHYNYFISKMDMAVERHVAANFRSMTFRQTAYRRTNRIIPDVTRSGGGYEVLKSSGGVCTVRYTQYAAMDQKISGLFFGIIMSESKSFIRSLLRYLEKQEQARKS